MGATPNRGDTGRSSSVASAFSQSSLARSLALLILGLAMVLGSAFIAVPERIVGFPNWFWPHARPFWWPFRIQSLEYSWTALLATVAGFALLGAAVWWASRLSSRRLVLLVTMGSILINIAVLALPADGLRAYAHRQASSAHMEFFIRASLHPHLLSTLTSYESLIRDGERSFFSRQKGPANLAYYVALYRLAQTSWVRPLLDRSIRGESRFSESIYEKLKRKAGGAFERFDRSRAIEVSRAFLLMPIASMLFCSVLPIPIFVLGRNLFSREAAVVAAATAAVIPPILFDQVHLDGSVFPLLFGAGFALFVRARHQSSSWQMLFAGVLAGLYAYFTLAAVALVALCAGGMLLDAVGGLGRDRSTHGNVTLGGSTGLDPRGSVKGLIVYALGLLGTLSVLRLTLAFHFIDRYVDARQIQAQVRNVTLNVDASSWRWMMLNCIEFGFSLGPLLMCLALVGAAMGLFALASGRASVRDTTSLAVLGTFALLVVAGDNSEVHRLWAFVGVAFLVPAIYAANELFRFARRGGRLAYWILLFLWTAAISTRFGFPASA